jgi:hypothetical protein|tara:strand:- start:11511 stop:14207 length:2697 start_codon:yes stop_codon:yes gene_type:complete
MSSHIQNIDARLRAKGQELVAKAEQAASSVSSQFQTSGKITVGGVASAVEGSLSDITGATLDMPNSINGISGATLGSLDLAQGGISQVLNSKLPGFGGAGKLIGGSLGGLNQAFGGLMGGIGKQENILNPFSSYNYVFTLGCLTDFELNFPDQTYRYNDPLITIIKSGGGSPLTGSKTVYEVNGKTEYFIDDVEIETIIAPNSKTRGTNAVAINFKVQEPYSMGLFLQALQISALSAGHKNYIMAPFCLSVEFKGHAGNRPVSIPNSRRIFPLKLVNVEFEVTEGGSQYAVQAIPFHETALTDQTQSTRNDITFEGRTIAEMLQWGFDSLTTNMNEKELEGVEQENKSKANQYIVMFPTKKSSAEESAAFSKVDESQEDNSATSQGNDSGSGTQKRELTKQQQQRLYESAIAVQEKSMSMEKFKASLDKELGITVRRSDLGETIRDYADKEENINDIGKSKIVKSKDDVGCKGFVKSGAAQSETESGKIDRCKVQVNPEHRVMTVSNGKKIEQIIEDVILLSEFGRSIVEQKPDENGMLDWYRLETNVYVVTDHNNVDKTGSPPQIFVYKVVPYKVHHSNFRSPTEPSKGIPNLMVQAVKQYDYIYTGQNDDIINFDINFNAAFFTGIAGDFGQKTADAKTSASSGASSGNKTAATGTTESDSSSVNANAVKADVNKGNTTDTGGVMVHPESIVAANFNEALVNSPVDLLSVDLEIWGDPYYIADSGMGNYSAAQGPGTNLNSDGTMDYQSGEVDIELNFRTPIDYVGNYMTFPGGGSAPVGAFSGLYKVLFVANKFSRGQFTQTLQTIRRPKQITDTNQVATESTGAVTATDPKKQLEKTETNPLTGNPEGASAGGGPPPGHPEYNKGASKPTKNQPSKKLPGTARQLSNGRIVGEF